MIRIIDEEGYNVKVVLNNLNLRMKYYDFLVIKLGDMVKVLDIPSFLIKTKSSDLLVSGRPSSDTEEALGIVRYPDSKNFVFTLNFENRSLSIDEIDEDGEINSLDTWADPVEVYINVEKSHSNLIYNMSRESFDVLMRRSVEANLEKVSIGDTVYHLIHMKSYKDYPEFVNDLKTASN